MRENKRREVEGRENGKKVGFQLVWNSRKIKEERKLTVDPTNKVFIIEMKRNHEKMGLNYKIIYLYL